MEQHAPPTLELPTARFTLRPYQREAVDAALASLRGKKEENGLLVLPTGAGKSLVIASLVKELAEPVIIFQPSKEILAQNVEKFRAYGGHCGIYSASAGEKRWADVTFATIGSVINKKHLLERFKYVIIDECFPAGTLIDGRPIEDIKPGDVVDSYNHFAERVERRKVLRTFKHSRKNDLVRVTLVNGSSFVCTYNHPIHTVESGYVCAGFLTNESVLYRHGATNDEALLCGVQQGVQPNNQGRKDPVLQQGVRGDIQGEEQGLRAPEVQQVREGFSCQGIHPEQLAQNGAGVLLGNLRDNGSEGHSGCCCNPCPNESTVQSRGFVSDALQQPHVDAGQQGEDGGINEGTNLSQSWGKRAAHEAPVNVAPCNRVADGACDRDGCGHGGASVTPLSLQSGPCRPGGETGNRSGWEVTSATEMAVPGPPQDDGLERIGVASVEVYKRASRAGDHEVREDDTVYNFEVDINHNYFANGVLVHNCDLVNSDGGMYEDLINHLDKRVVGLTATPYRLSTGTNPHTYTKYSILKFLTRTNPRIFNRVLYHVQCKTLSDQGFWAKYDYREVKAINRQNLQANSTGADYTDASMRAEYRASDMQGKIVRVVNRVFHPDVNRRNCLVFTRYVEEAEFVVRNVPGCAIVTAKTHPKERDRVISGFRSGRIRCVVNVGILTVGFDYPELEAIVMARPTRSLRLWYQVVGRGARPHPQKKDCLVIDMGGNLAQFGKVEDLELRQETGWHVYGLGVGRVLTNVPFGDQHFKPRQ